MHINKLLTSVFKINIVLSKESDNVYTIVRETSPDSTRYALMVNKGKNPVIYDRKLDTVVTTDFPTELTGLPNYVTNPNVNPLANLEQLFKAGETLPNPYTKGLCSLLDNKSNYRVYPTKIIAFYTNYIDFPKFVGAKEYPLKKSLKGSIMKSSYCVHKYNKNNTSWVIGEGLKECIVASKALDGYNVIESGGVGNTSNILRSLPSSDTKLLLGENDTVETYTKIVTDNSNTKVNYPLTKYKDFADQYLAEKSLSSIKLAMEGKDIRQSVVKYKALGVRGHNFYIYIANENTVYECGLHNIDSLLNLVCENMAWIMWKVAEKKKAFFDIRNECALIGEYNTDNEYGVGLWKYHGDHLYNTGSELYKVLGENIVSVKYSDFLNNDFLLVKKETDQPTLNTNEYNPLPLDNAMSLCDWEFKSHYQVLLGFLLQSYYAGAISFRPNLWLMSDSSSAGKTWLTSRIKKHVTPGAIVAESGKTTPAGLRQLMSDYSTLLFVDEFGEANTPDKANTYKILEMFRSTATGSSKVVLGTAHQKPISQRLRLSAFLSCINGLECVEEQDYERFIFIRLLRKDKKNFYDNIEPAFEALEDQSGFAAYALTRYSEYLEYLPLMERETRKSLSGHKIRGLASVLAGYAAFRGDITFGHTLLSDLKREDKGMFSPYKGMEDSDILLRCLTSAYCDTLTQGADGARVYRTLHEGAIKGDVKAWGLKLFNNNNELAINTTLFFQLMQKVSPLDMRNTTRASFRQCLRLSRYCTSSDERLVRFGKASKRCLTFDNKAILIGLGTSREDSFDEA